VRIDDEENARRGLAGNLQFVANLHRLSAIWPGQDGSTELVQSKETSAMGKYFIACLLGVPAGLLVLVSLFYASLDAGASA
jgi:hypothetical protein